MLHKSLVVLALITSLASPVLADRQAQRAADIATGEAKLAQLTKGLVPGKPESCAPTQRWTGSQNIDHVGILYELGGQRYLNRMDPDCADFGFNAIPVIVSHGMICRGDIVRIVDSASGLPRGSCALGDFIRYEKPRRP